MSTSLIPVEKIEQTILLIRGQKIILDADIAELYGVETKVLKRAVKRNLDRFPPDFMFQLSHQELMEPPKPKKKRIGFVVDED